MKLPLSLTHDGLTPEALFRSPNGDESSREVSAAAGNALAAQILERITDAFVSLDCDWRFTYVNAKAAQLLKRNADDLIGAHIWEEFPDCIGNAFYDAFYEAAETQTPVHMEGFSSALGLWAQARVYPGPDGISAFFQDIAERKQAEIERAEALTALRESEQRLRLAIKSGKFGSFHVDLTTREFIDISDTYKATFGYSPDQTFTFSMVAAALHPDDLPRARAEMQEAIANRQDYETEARCIWPDGSVHWVLARGSAVYDEANQPVRLIGVIQDITDRKRAEADQARALKEAEERADRDFLTGLLNHRAFYKRLDEESSRARREDTTMAVVLLDLDNFQYFNGVYGHATGDEVLRQVAERLNTICRPYDIIARFGGDEFAMLLCNIGYATARDIEERIHKALEGLVYRPEGQNAAIPITLTLGAALCEGDALDRREVVRQADERMRWLKGGGEPDVEAESVRRTALKDIGGFSMLDALVAAVDNKDRYTRRHSEDVMTYSLMIAQEMGLDEETRRIIAVAALLHDVGKIGVPDAILRKPSSLTPDELAAIRQHPEMGAIIVSAVPGLESTLHAVRHHHECWDGTGYPSGLAGEDIPLIARLMAVADAYNAMTTNRPYRQAMAPMKALSILEQGAGSQWDPACVTAFRSALLREMAKE